MLMGMFGLNGKKCLESIIFGLILIILAFAVLACAETNQTAPDIYIALGDSVPSGYGLDVSAASSEGIYPSIFFEKLKSEGVVDEYYNMASNGFTTNMLLELLNNMDSDQVRLFGNARIVTVNIGGNNILKPFLAYLSDLQLMSGIGHIRAGAGGALSGAWGVLHEILSGVGSVVSDSAETGFDVDVVMTRFREVLSGVSELIGGAGKMIAGSSDVVSVWRGSLSPELEAVLEEGVLTFSEEFKEIILWIETNAPNATVIVNTIYNPIPKDVLMVSIPISRWADAFIDSMNRTIVQESGPNGFLVADIHYNFLNRPDLINLNLNPLAGNLSLDIVHPNDKGHSLIAELNYESFSQNAVFR